MVKWFGIGEDNISQDNDNVEYYEPETEVVEIGQIALDIIDTHDNIIVVAPVAGIELEDIDVSLNDGVLTLSGQRNKPSDIYNDDAIVKNSECFWGKFTRNVILPENLDFDSVKATMENSLLRVQINKLNFSSKKIEVENLDD